MMKEDDENVEIWFLMGVAFFQQTPPDLALSEQYLTTAQNMLEKVRESMLQDPETAMSPEDFPYDAQVRLCQEQLILVQQVRWVACVCVCVCACDMVICASAVCSCMIACDLRYVWCGRCGFFGATGKGSRYLSRGRRRGL